ncbi:MAG: acetate kinase [Acutalibacteraceae bacterium]|nr:acetate kinase [Acutalibacteraceae bacterium]
MKILVINAGSSSLKYQLIDMNGEVLIAKGLCDRIGVPENSNIEHKVGDKKFAEKVAMPTHVEAFEAVIKALTTGDGKVIDDISEIAAIGHRVVQGGSLYAESVLIDDKVLSDIEDLGELAPLHNPAHALAMRACTKVFGKDVPQVATFDTAFHQTMPAKAFMYGIPYEFYTDHKIRRYGAHGTSHRFVSARCAEVMGKDLKDIKMITCHLGNGCSISAIKDGVCVDTSMGLTPLDGFMMGTRSGGVDPSILTYLMKKCDISPDEMNTILNKKSGLLGVSGISNDSRDVIAAAEAGNERAKLAFEMQNYQIAKFVGSYAAAMGGVDAIVFTGGIGENERRSRKYVCNMLEFLGFTLDLENNDTSGKEIKISTEDSKVQVWVIPTNEELLIARDTLEIVSK